MRSTSSAALLLTLAPAGAILMSAPRKSEAIERLGFGAAVFRLDADSGALNFSVRRITEWGRNSEVN